ncbi:hypothetical protein LguiA_002098 [Lonicera macranthoides]
MVDTVQSFALGTPKFNHSLPLLKLEVVIPDFATRNPQLAWEEPTILERLTTKRESFKSGSRFNFFQHFIYSFKQKLHGLFWKIAEISVPQIRRICDIKTTNHHALELVKWLCFEAVKLDHSKAYKLLGVPLNIASCEGVHEIVEEILASVPTMIYFVDEMKRSLFHIAIVNRQENVFNIIYQVEHKHIFFKLQDRSLSNCLHLAGCFEYEQKLHLQNRVAGAALQVQRELQWFKVVEEFTQIHEKEQKNNTGRTPLMVFNETHLELIAQGEKWMKQMSNSYTIVGALIVTIVFAAAITVPGGNNGSTGFPILTSNPAFLVFALSDALALFASTSSVLMFLSILTSRYGVEDFLYALPKRLIIGLATLFLSILFMMIAFGATLQIVIGDRVSWILIPVVGAFTGTLKDSTGSLLAAGSSFRRAECEVVLAEAQSILVGLAIIVYNGALELALSSTGSSQVESWQFQKISCSLLAATLLWGLKLFKIASLLTLNALQRFVLALDLQVPQCNFIRKLWDTQTRLMGKLVQDCIFVDFEPTFFDSGSDILLLYSKNPI